MSSIIVKGIVTLDDIDEGQVGSCSMCPLSIAINRVLGGKFDISVATEDVLMLSKPPYTAREKTYYRETVIYRARLSKDMADFVTRFDTDRQRVGPMSFEFEMFDADDWRI